MLFGMIPQTLMNQFTRAVSAFEQAADRAALVLKGKTAEKFQSGTFRAACLCMDASNKGGKNLVTKPFTTLDADGFVWQGCFNMDLTVTKKADLGSDLTIQALTTELGEAGMYTIKGGSCDKYGVAEVVKALRHIDRLRMAVWQANSARNRLLMTLTSARYPTIKYLYCLGYFASERIRSCMMHAFECVLKLLLEKLMGKQGPGLDGTTAQSLYRLAYYMLKFKEFVSAMNATSVGGEVSDLDNCPRVVRKIFKKICSSRWVSTERQTFELVRLLNAPASEDLVAAVSGDFEHTADWEECLELFTPSTYLEERRASTSMY
jgi:hypothetical protein